MASFSRRNGYNLKDIQLECAGDTLVRRIWACFYKKEFVPDDMWVMDNPPPTTGIEDMMIEMGVPYEFPQNQIVKAKNAEALKNYLMGADEWYIIYDFIERYLNRVCDENTVEMMQNEFNLILEDEVSAYRVVEGLVVPLTSEGELETIASAKSTKYDVVNIHISKALELFASRNKPDYENSIKESISAVESICCIITGESGANATLGKTIKKLKDNGIYIHSAFEKAFSSMYGFASDEDGIRHGGIDFKGAASEDARYMLVSCSAFINYLIEKWRKSC